MTAGHYLADLIRHGSGSRLDLDPAEGLTAVALAGAILAAEAGTVLDHADPADVPALVGAFRGAAVLDVPAGGYLAFPDGSGILVEADYRGLATGGWREVTP